MPLLDNAEDLQQRLEVDVGKRLGGGATGRVYQATFDGQEVALKVTHPNLGKGRGEERAIGCAHQLRASFSAPWANPPEVSSPCLRAAAARKPEQINAFLKEARLLARLAHRCVLEGLCAGGADPNLLARLGPAAMRGAFRSDPTIT